MSFRYLAVSFMGLECDGFVDGVWDGGKGELRKVCIFDNQKMHIYLFFLIINFCPNLLALIIRSHKKGISFVRAE